MPTRPPHPTFATHPTHSTRPRRSPRLALVLGSGDARSVAALGLAEVLARAGVAPDLVVGCRTRRCDCAWRPPMRPAARRWC